MRRSILLLPLLAFVVAFLSGCATARDPGVASGPDAAVVGRGGIVVRATFRDLPLADARVAWLTTAGEEKTFVPATGMTDTDGSVAFDLPPGKYFLTAAWRKDGDYARKIVSGDRFAFFGGNPVYVSGQGAREIYLSLEEFVETLPLAAEPVGGTGVSGHVLSGGAPLAMARVYAYIGPQAGFRDLGFASSAPTGPDGSFLLDLPPGEYYLVTRRREEGGIAGPMRKGDHFGFYPGNPVTVTPGRFTRVAIPATLLKLRNVPSYSGVYKAAAFVEGRILDPAGRPAKGVYAALYDNPELLNRPVHFSEVTGEDGRFRLPVPVPGTYFLGARSGYGGMPVPGDLYGRFEGNPVHSITVKEGDNLTGVDIVVTEVR